MAAMPTATLFHILDIHKGIIDCRFVVNDCRRKKLEGLKVGVEHGTDKKFYV
jgi:hypothetical protein